MKRLIVNADDFGLTSGINSAVTELNRAGALTSSTLMAGAPCFAAAVELACAQPTLAVGCHVVLTDGSPVSPPSEIPSLIDPNLPSSGLASGQFRPALGSFVTDLLRGRIREAEIEAEAIAQIQRIQSAGLRVTHLDTHKHTHVFPQVLRPLLRAAGRCGVRAMRNPVEPLWSLRATPGASAWRKLLVRALGARRAGFLRMTQRAGVATTDGALGLSATGTLDRVTLLSLLSSMPDGTWELVCHPGYHDSSLDQVRTRLKASREVEREALSSTIPQALSHSRDLTLIDFGRLQ